MPNIPADEMKRVQKLTEWKSATWHGPDATRVKTEPMGSKVDVKPEQTVKLHPLVAKDVSRERLWEVEGYSYVPVGEEKKPKPKKETK